MSDTSLCKYSDRVFVGILDNYPKDAFPMNYDTVAYYDEVRDSVVSILNERFTAKIKRTLKEWPICANGGTVNVVFENSAGYFKCDKCEPEYNTKPNHNSGQIVENREIEKALDFISSICCAWGSFALTGGVIERFPAIKNMCANFDYSKETDVYYCLLKSNYWNMVKDIKRLKKEAKERFSKI